MVGDCGEYLKLWLEVLAQVHDTGHITTAVTIIWCRPDSDNVLVFEMVFVAFVDELMGTGDELEAVDVVELIPSTLDICT